MGLLDDLLGGLAGEASPSREPEPRSPSSAGGGLGPILTALLPVVLSMMSSSGNATQTSGRSTGGGLGGGLGDILGQVLGGGSGRSGGGLRDLLSQMQRAGFGDQARSWVGTGQNMPISADAMEKIFGKGGVAEIARRAGVSEQDASRGLSQLMPGRRSHDAGRRRAGRRFARGERRRVRAPSPATLARDAGYARDRVSMR